MKLEKRKREREGAKSGRYGGRARAGRQAEEEEEVGGN